MLAGPSRTRGPIVYRVDGSFNETSFSPFLFSLGLMLDSDLHIARGDISAGRSDEIIICDRRSVLFRSVLSFGSKECG